MTNGDEAQSPAPEPRLCLFARAPELGSVKRRLAADIGPAGALRAHEQLVQDALERLASVAGLETELWLAGPAAPALARWPAARQMCLRQQQGDDLGARMQHALGASLEVSGRALVVGSDCPGIDAAYVRAAVAALDHGDVVLGPAEDGGYGLIGARREVATALAPLFRDMPWGTARVHAATLQRCADSGLRVAELDTVWDVDTLADWERYLQFRRDRC